MRIGDVEFDSPLLLAPLAGVSDSPFRRLAREQGASGVYTEMVSADGLVRGNRATLDYCAFEPCERPIGIQLFGSGLLTILWSAFVARLRGRYLVRNYAVVPSALLPEMPESTACRWLTYEDVEAAGARADAMVADLGRDLTDRQVTRLAQPRRPDPRQRRGLPADRGKGTRPVRFPDRPAR